MSHGQESFHPPKQASREEMSSAKLDVAFQDSCAYLLIPLNKLAYAAIRHAFRRINIFD